MDFDVPCTYDRPAKKRGKQVFIADEEVLQDKEYADSDSLESSRKECAQLSSATAVFPRDGQFPQDARIEADGLVDFPLAKGLGEMALAHSDKIANLVNVYFEVVYPIFPLFHRGTLRRKVAEREYLTDRGLFAAVMSICALASARARDGALPPGRWDPAYFSTPTAETFCAAAQSAIPSELGSSRGLNYMRSCALLALYGVQLGKVEIMHQYLGIYHALVALDGLHDEKNWPDGIGRVEREERRRLVKLIATIWDVYWLILIVLVHVYVGSLLFNRVGRNYSMQRVPISCLFPIRN